MKTIDENRLYEALYVETRQAWRDLKNKHQGEDFYAFGLYTSEGEFGRGDQSDEDRVALARPRNSAVAIERFAREMSAALEQTWNLFERVHGCAFTRKPSRRYTTSLLTSIKFSSGS